MTNRFDDASENWDQSQRRVVFTQQIALQIRELVPWRSDFEMLDFGCGTGLLGFQLLPHVQHADFADTSSGMLEQVQNKVQASEAHKVQTLDLKNQSIEKTYDLIVSSMALHHIEDAEATVHQLAEQLKEHGYLCLCDLDTEDGSFHGSEEVAHHGFDRQEVASWMASKGLSMVESRTGFQMPKNQREYPIFLLIGAR